MSEKITVRVDPDLRELLPDYLAGRNRDVPALREMLDKQDFEGARTAGHKMKGSGKIYGFDGISAIGAEIEAAAKERNAPLLKELTDKLADYLERVEVI